MCFAVHNRDFGQQTVCRWQALSAMHKGIINKFADVAVARSMSHPTARRSMSTGSTAWGIFNQTVLQSSCGRLRPRQLWSGEDARRVLRRRSTSPASIRTLIYTRRCSADRFCANKQTKMQTPPRKSFWLPRRPIMPAFWPCSMTKGILLRSSRLPSTV